MIISCQIHCCQKVKIMEGGRGEKKKSKIGAVFYKWHNQTLNSRTNQPNLSTKPNCIESGIPGADIWQGKHDEIVELLAEVIEAGALSCRTKWGQERSYYYLHESNPEIPDIEFEHLGKEEETSLEAIQARMTKTTLLLTSFATVLVFLK